MNYQIAFNNITGDIVSILKSGGGSVHITPNPTYTVVNVEEDTGKKIKEESDKLRYSKDAKNFVRKEV